LARSLLSTWSLLGPTEATLEGVLKIPCIPYAGNLCEWSKRVHLTQYSNHNLLKQYNFLEIYLDYLASKGLQKHIEIPYTCQAWCASVCKLWKIL
jgi:hypothetical protein